MRSIAALGTVMVFALLLTSTSCASGTPPTPSLATPGQTPSGSLTLSGAIIATVTAGTQNSRAGCRAISQMPPPPATNITFFLTGEVDFGSGLSVVVLRFMGVAGTTKLPLPGESLPGFVVIATSGSEWHAGQSSPTSSGTLTLARSGGGAIHGSVDASLAPLRGSAAHLLLAGSWNC